MKKGNVKTILSAFFLIIVFSGSFLFGSYALAAAPVTEKKYDVYTGEVLFIEEIPTPQSELQKKFYEMYEINESDHSIRVISEEYLTRYWQNVSEGEIRSLTTEEVLFIIQDTVRLYCTYEKILLPEQEVGMLSSFREEEDTIITVREPFESWLRTLGEPNAAVERAVADIYKIILCRLAALSSRECFVYSIEVFKYASASPVCCFQTIAGNV